MSTDTKAPSAGAMRVETTIQQWIAMLVCGVIAEEPHPIPNGAIAELVDRETHVAELVEALEHISERDPCACIPEGCNHGPEETGCIGCVARRALHRFKEGL